MLLTAIITMSVMLTDEAIQRPIFPSLFGLGNTDCNVESPQQKLKQFIPTNGFSKIKTALDSLRDAASFMLKGFLKLF